MNSQFPQIWGGRCWGFFLPPARLGTLGKSLLPEWAGSFRIYPEETWPQFLRAPPRDGLVPSSASSEAETFHKLTIVGKANVRKKKKKMYGKK